MQFLGIEFVLFFILTTIFSYMLQGNNRCLFLLAAGYFFYGIGQPGYLPVLFLSTLLDYFIALKIGAVKNKGNRKAVLIFGIIANVGLLFFFKYFNFFNDFFRSLSGALKITYPVPSFKILLPLGISYYIFRKISYIVDVYRGHITPERNFVRVALYVSFFPEMPAGPIDRAAALLPQFLEKIKINFTWMAEGLQSIGWGLFKKLVLADRLAKLVNAVFDHPEQHHGPVIGLAAIFYGFQVYCDFSGYSDIAIGLGRILGFRLMENFKQPFLAESIPDFWRRWHISLSSWLRDYLFLPISYSLMRKLDKNKILVKTADRWAYVGSVLCTMLLCGLWHGANWTFAAWGLLHGLLLVISFAAKKTRKRTVRFLHLKKFPLLLRAGRIVFTFGLVSFSWVFFRAHSIKEAFTMIAGFFSAGPDAVAGKAGSGTLLVGLSRPEFLIAIAAIVFLLIVEILLEKKDEPVYRLLSGRPVWIRWAVYYLVIFSILLFGIYEQQVFIYGRF